MTLLDGKRYWEQHEAWQQGRGEKPKFDPTLELLRGLFRHEYPVSVHTQIYQVVLTTLQQLRLELGLWTVVVHGEFDAYRLSGNALAAGMAVAAGPRNYHFDRATSTFLGLAQVWHDGGKYYSWMDPVPGLGRDGIGLNTDSPVVPEEQLPLQGAIAVRLGLPHEVALRALTINNATFAGIDHRVGSLEVGKDADVVVWSHHPLSTYAIVERTYIDGIVRYDREMELARIAQAEKEKASTHRPAVPWDGRKARPNSADEAAADETTAAAEATGAETTEVDMRTPGTAGTEQRRWADERGRTPAPRPPTAEAL